MVTDAFSANVHGIAIDPSGAAIAVGWDSALGSRRVSALGLVVRGGHVQSVHEFGPTEVQQRAVCLLRARA